MTKLLLTAVLAATAFAQAPSQQNAPAQTPLGWQRYSDPVGLFSVLVPAAPQAKPPTSDKAGTYYVLTVAHAGRAFVIAYNDPTYDMTEPQVELNSNRNSFLASLKASLVSEHRFYSSQPVGQVPATEFTCESQEWECRSRTFITVRRGYQVAVLTRRGAVSSLDPDRFLDSFQILQPR